MDYFLGLDVGTSAVKAILVRPRGDVAGSESVPLRLTTPKPGWAEQKPSDWWRASASAIRRVLQKTRVRAAKVASVGLSGQMHSSVFLDGKNAVIRPALLWCDGRTSEECREITEHIGEERLREWTLNPALEGFTLPKVLWLKKHEPAAFTQFAKVLLPKDYVRFRLTGTLATEPSDASGTLMYDTAGLKWSEPLMKALGLSMSLLPDVGGSADILGKVSSSGTKATGLLAGTPVAGGGADNACSAVGVGAVSPGDVVASWGTSGTVLAPVIEPKGDPALRAHTFCHALPRMWYVMGVMLTAGGAFAWLGSVTAVELDRLSAEAAKVSIGADGITFLPYLQGERTPHRDASARGAFIGLSLSHTRAHMARAVLEGVSFGMRDSVLILREVGLPLRNVLITGGGARSRLLRELQADVYGLPVVTVNREEGAAYGAALLGAVAAGAFESVPAACRATLERGKPIEPNLDAHSAYEAPYQRFRSLYPALKGRF